MGNEITIKDIFSRNHIEDSISELDSNDISLDELLDRIPTRQQQPGKYLCLNCGKLNLTLGKCDMFLTYYKTLDTKHIYCVLCYKKKFPTKLAYKLYY
jgi:hypothetical protein